MPDEFQPVRIPLADVSEMPLSVLFSDAMTDTLASSVDAVLKQVQRPRANLGGSGPPGRMD